MSRLKLFLILGLALAFAAGCSETPEEPDLAEKEQAIVGGSNEYGWDSVGALTFTYYGEYYGSYCTATLIDSNWLLTAAHCLVEHDGVEITPAMTEFYVGNDANPTSNGGKPSGDYYQAGAFYVHPNYDDQTLENDIGLVYLSDTVPETTIPYNDSNLSYSVEGEDIFYVGFGATEGVYSSNSGVKRSVYVTLGDLYSNYFTSEYTGTGTCFGDSGGPALYQIGGQWRVIGVNSGVYSPSGDPCKGTYFATRVDYFDSWINTIVSGGTPNCNNTPGMCSCDAACTSSGTCDNSQCAALNCGEIYDCMVNCGNDQQCSNNCYAQGDSTAQSQLQSLFTCLENYCENASDYQTCAETNCGNQIDTCFDVPTGTLSCEESYSCMVDCGADSDCQNNCYYSASETGQGQLNDLFTCFNTCDSVPDDQFTECVGNNCPNELDACFPPDNCSMLGGDCGNNACYFNISGSTSCYSTENNGVGQSCDPNLSDRLACEDGSICVPESEGSSSGICLAFCYNNNHCGSGEVCEDLGWADDPGLGLCYVDEEPCTDADNDGYCVEDDCNDTQASVNPGQSEICGDGLDNNCNGTADEGCSTECTDNDNDGVCYEFDCDDYNADINPGEQEICGDNIDNNCSGETDEGCSTCVDDDGDGVCTDTDCNDNNDTVYPGADEICGDGLDNNCDGTRDEGCPGGCTDADSDGACVPYDCNDSDPNTNPSASEICGDGFDNNCNGTAEEGCGGVCVDADGDGTCSTQDCDDNDPAVTPIAQETCGDGVDNNCNGTIDENCDEDVPSTGGSSSGSCSISERSSKSSGLLLVVFGLVALVWRRRR